MALLYGLRIDFDALHSFEGGTRLFCFPEGGLFEVTKGENLE